ncbi:gluconate 2-dehydrogenase subunit 3 family protein [Sphingobacterium hungaricum]
MNRRTAIQQLFIIAGGMMIASSCSSDRNKASIELANIDVSAEEEDVLGNVVEAIIPKTDSPGARELNLHLFVLKMVDDCHGPEDQKRFLDGLKNAKSQKGKTTSEIQEYLKNLPADDAFLSLVKKRTIQGYLNSEYVMKNKLIYELVPARYNGALKIEA